MQIRHTEYRGTTIRKSALKKPPSRSRVRPNWNQSPRPDSPCSPLSPWNPAWLCSRSSSTTLKTGTPFYPNALGAPVRSFEIHATRPDAVLCPTMPWLADPSGARIRLRLTGRTRFVGGPSREMGSMGPLFYVWQWLRLEVVGVLSIVHLPPSFVSW